MSFGKHFINDVEDPVERGLKCLLRLNQSLRLIESERGGGLGHELAHAGYLDEGMLDICVVGQIVASPSALQILAGLKALDTPRGILMIVKNYTGDKLNFGLAAQKATAQRIQVKVIFVGDDVSVKNNGLVGRRGLAGVAFVHKIAGALAAAGYVAEGSVQPQSLTEYIQWHPGGATDIAQRVADSISTASVILDRCNVPRRGQQQSLPFEHLEYGMGIHNESSVRRDTIPSFSTNITNILSLLTPSAFNSTLPEAVMTNNLGSLSILEQNAIAGDLMDQLERTGHDIRRMLVGTFATSLDGPGSSPATEKPCLPPVDTLLVQKITRSILESVTRDEPLITKYDTIAGDGDGGKTLLKGVNGKSLPSPSLPPSSILYTKLTHLPAPAIHDHFSRISSPHLDLITTSTQSPPQSKPAWAGPPALSTQSSSTLSPTLFPQTQTLPWMSPPSSQPPSNKHSQNSATARQPVRGQKTIMDALIPFIEAFAKTLDFELAAREVERGSEGTRGLDAVLGRASYVSKESLMEEESGMGVS
ncbi:uncharacterized protein PAC_19654 [Phialocephala subalpina]|uniref:DhaK domain-containing protein n=1 Tax=Phialocephala subalpina TaxID=576137 RepID=A0A1L7XXH9_9HELO|nr:uncharacterized protein PAC_19654 [Phialocephala subalpina]